MKLINMSSTRKEVSCSVDTSTPVDLVARKGGETSGRMTLNYSEMQEVSPRGPR